MKLGRISQVLIIIFIISLFGFGNFNEVAAQGSWWETVKNVGWTFGTAGMYNGQQVPSAASTAAKLLPFDDIAQQMIRPLLSIQSFMSTVAMGVAGSIFDFVLNFAVRDIRGTYTDYFEGAVTDLWKIFRDIGNILIIFSLLYLAIRTIIEGNGFADRKTLTRILIAALLINFSLFFTKIVFDVSNRVSVEIYQAIRGPNDTVNGQARGLTEDLIKDFRLQSNLTVGSIGSGFSYVTDVFSGNGNKIDEIGQEMLATFMIVAMSITIGIIFIIGALMLIYRTLMFVLLMAFSAIGVVGSLVPFLRPYLGFWWKNLWKHAIALPVFMLMFYVAFVFIQGSFSEQMTGNLVGIFNGNDTNFNQTIKMLVFYIMSMALLVMTVILPMKIGDRASRAAISSSKAIGRFGANVVAGGSALLGRNTIGAAGRYAGNLSGNSRFGEDVRRLTAAQLGKDSLKDVVAGAGLRKLIDSGKVIGEKKTYDARNIKVGKQTLGQRLGLGKGAENYESIIKTRQQELSEKEAYQRKAYGWDKQTDDEKRDLVRMKGEKAAIESGIKNLVKDLAKVTPGSAEANNINVKLEQKKGELSDIAVKIGKLQEKGSATFAKQQQGVMSILGRAIKADVQGIEAIHKLDKDRKKKILDGVEKRFDQLLGQLEKEQKKTS